MPLLHHFFEKHGNVCFGNSLCGVSPFFRRNRLFFALNGDLCVPFPDHCSCGLQPEIFLCAEQGGNMTAVVLLYSCHTAEIQDQHSCQNNLCCPSRCIVSADGNTVHPAKNCLCRQKAFACYPFYFSFCCLLYVCLIIIYCPGLFVK